MKHNSKIFALLLSILMIVTQAGYVAAQGEVPLTNAPEQLTPEQMKVAIPVRDGKDSSRSATGGVYYLESCNNNADVNTPCYIVVLGSGSFPKKANDATITPLASTATITCGINIYNRLGAKVARLQQNVGVTFSGTFGQTPVTLNWGDLRGTSALPGYSWSGLTGPTPNPNWGIYVARSGTAYVTSGGMLSFAINVIPPLQTYVSSRLTITSSGWRCS
jgi:hypothetical protein